MDDKAPTEVAGPEDFLGLPLDRFVTDCASAKAECGHGHK